MAVSRSADVVSGAVLAGLGVFIVVEASGWEYLGADGPGPGFFPLWYGMAMVALSLALVAGALRARVASRPPVDWREVGRALATWAAFSGCVGLLKVLGFVLSFALLTLFVVGVMYRRPPAVALAAAVGLPGGFYLLFPFALNVGLPTGLLGF